MAEEIATKENLADQYLDDYDFQVEEYLMQYGDSVIIDETEDFLLWDCDDDVIVLNFVKRGLTIRISYSEWEELRYLLTNGENPEDLDRASDVQIYGQGDNEYALYFPHNRLNLLFRRREFERFKLMVLRMGSPYPWGKRRLAEA
jgi:hypothetical protein